ncbi:MAG TPA: MBOAT family protein, partial [Thermoanaerobaculia bacterium]|nr:MBOAT family protein [Thermoanaerobaculia bacterium]
NPAFMGLMLLSTVVDYACGRWISGGREVPLDPAAPRTRGQRAAVAVSVSTNLALLGFFKYFNFAVESYNGLLAAVGLADLGLETALRVTLPLGISFYTFQSMSYTIDVYRGQAAALRSFVDFACYVSLFPQLVAGPIIRFSEVADQLRRRSHTVEKLARGAAFFCLGMSKKVLLADPCGRVADAAFDAASVASLDAWYGVLAYAFQIYFDFSAYSDMAIGLGLMLGFVFPKNFDSPYKADSITDFWRRWHVSLSTWLRDYLYIPLGGNRLGAMRTYVNLGVVMVLGGLWHGASWNFVLWGGLHGGWLAFERVLGKRPAYARLPRPLRVAITFLVVLVGWVFFRAPDLPAAGRYLAAMAGIGEPGPAAALLSGVLYRPHDLLAVGLAAAIAFAAPQTWDWTRRLAWWKGAACVLLLWLALVVLETEGYSPFIYFIF